MVLLRQNAAPEATAKARRPKPLAARAAHSSSPVSASAGSATPAGDRAAGRPHIQEPPEPSTADGAAESSPGAVARLPTPESANDSTAAAPSTETASGAVSALQPALPAVAPAAAADDAELRRVVRELYENKKLLIKKEYPTLRKAIADHFEKQHAAQIRQGLGDDHDAMMAWFNEHADIKEELFLAIDPAADRIPQVMALFRELKNRFPEKIVSYANLAIATTVVWDQERGAIYNYAHHAHRTKASLPDGMLGAIDNFQYLVDAEPLMQGRLLYVPWEFLVYVVDHRTPLDERKWALASYVNKRVMFGKCYSDVPYDYDMLRAGNPRLAGKSYTLANLKAFGGVCAMQADFASRVGKSIGVPAAYVGGEASTNDRHAWVMWVELKQATATGLVFTLESHGRYQDDKYYLGTLHDPQTGQPITDRDMELRLQTVGLDVVAKRQTDLVMRAFPWLKEDAQLDTTKQLVLLGQIINLSPGNEDAWSATATLFKENAGNKQHQKQYQAILDKLFVTFARVPDFTWKLFDDFAAYQEDDKSRLKLYERLCGLYEAAGRPDLACKARLKLTDMLVAEQRPLDAALGLAYTVKRFPDEGRYVPRLLDKLEELCEGIKDGGPHLVKFYTEFLPLVPKRRGDAPIPYAIRVFERAAEVFTRHHQPQLAAAARAEGERLKAGK